MNVRQRLTLIVIAVAVPMLLLSAGLVWRFAERERDVGREAIEYSAHAILGAVDAQLGRYTAIAQVLANSPDLQIGDLASFRDDAERAAAALSVVGIALVDPAGQQLLNTAAVSGVPLPRLTAEMFEAEKRALETHQTTFADHSSGAVTNTQLVAVLTPVFRGGQAAYAVVVGISANMFRDLLHVQRLPDGWLVGMMDRNGRFIARSIDHEKWVGKPAAAGWRAVMDRNGWFEIDSVEGATYLVSNVRSTVSGWNLGVAVNKAAFEAPFRKTVLIGGIVGLCVTLASVLLAVWAARGISDPIRALEAGAHALRLHRWTTFKPTGVTEVDHVLAAFEAASQALNAQEAQRVQAEHALRDASARLRATVDTIVDAIVVIDERGVVQSVNPAVERIFGFTAQETIGRNITMLMPEPYRSEHGRYIESYLTTAKTKVIGIGREVQGRRKSGDVFPLDLAVAEWRADGKRYFTGIMRDITARKQAEEHVQFVMRELAHRTKNVLAVVQTIARQTARASRGLEDFGERFSRRVEALVRSHDLLTRQDWQGVRIGDLVRGQLELFGSQPSLDTNGPNLMLTPPATQNVGLALHELATNAAKYGALSTPEGRIEVGWGIDAANGSTPMFRMYWRESGGPPVLPPEFRGFGHTVIATLTERALNGHVVLDFRPEGLFWEVTAPAAGCLHEEA